MITSLKLIAGYVILFCLFPDFSVSFSLAHIPDSDSVFEAGYLPPSVTLLHSIAFEIVQFYPCG